MKCYNEPCICFDEAMCDNCNRERLENECPKILTEPLLKYGDEIEVTDRDVFEWVKRTFAKTEGGSFWCYTKRDGKDILPLKEWFYYRRLSPSLTWEDRDKLRDKWVRSKYGSKREKRLSSFYVTPNGEPCVVDVGNFEELIKNWEYLDGTPI
jgi:hypothetical protein